MKVFKLNEYDWWLAPSLELAIESAKGEFKLTEEELVENPIELTWQDMGKLVFKHEDLGDMTFAQEFYRQVAGGDMKPRMFASTEW